MSDNLFFFKSFQNQKSSTKNERNQNKRKEIQTYKQVKERMKRRTEQNNVNAKELKKK